MLNSGRSIDNTHLGDTKVYGDLEITEDLVIDEGGSIVITPPGCLTTDCVKPTTASGDVSIKTSGDADIAVFQDDKEVHVFNVIRPLTSDLSLTSFNNNGTLSISDGAGVPPPGVRVVNGDMYSDKYRSTASTALTDPEIDMTDGALRIGFAGGNTNVITATDTDNSVQISGAYKLPTAAGTDGQLLTVDAGGLTTSYQDPVLPLTPSQEIGYIAIANTSYNTSRTLIWSSLGGTNQVSTDVLGTGGYVEFKSIGKIYARRTQDGIVSATYFLEVDVAQTGGYNNTTTFQWSISDNVFVLDKDVDYERDYEFRFTIQRMNLNSFTVYGTGTCTQLVNPTGTIQLPAQMMKFQDVKDSDSNLLFTTNGTDVKVNVYFTAAQDPGVITSLVPFSGQFHGHQLGFLPEVVVNTSDHSQLTNLGLGDSHQQYSLLSGRSGGQAIIGGTVASDTLVLQSNAADPLDGHVEFKSFIDMQTHQILNVSTAGGIGQIVDGKLDKAGDTMTGVLKLPNGTAAAPALSFATAPTTGLSLDGFGKLLLSDSGTPSLKCNGANVSVFGTLSMNDNRLLEVATPVGPDDAANKQYVDDNALRIDGTLPMDGTLQMDGNSITGVLNINGSSYPPPPTSDPTKLNKAGDTMTGELKMSSQIISGVANPVNAQDAATKSYVDTATDGVVIGPGSSVNSHLCSFNGTTGKLIKNSGISAIGGNIDQSSGAPLKLGGLTAQSVDIGSATIPTYVLGGLDMNSKKINNLLDPTAAQDGATKAYVDTATDGVVIGPSSAVNSHLCSFDTTTGELIKDSGILQSDVVLKTGNNVMNGDLALLTAGNTELVITTTDPFNLARILLSANGVLSSMRQSDSRLRIASNNNRIDLDSVVSEIALSTSGTPRLTISDTEVRSYLPVVTDQSFRQYRAVNPAQNGFPVLSGMYSMISSRVIGGTLTETSCFNDSGAVGTRTNPANTLAVGDTYHLHMSGLVETDGKGHGMTFRLKMGATTLMTTNSDDWDAGGTPTFWELEVDFVIRTIGSLGTMIGGGMVTFSEDLWWKDAGSFSTTSDLAVNTTISNTFDVTAQWDNNNANNVLTTQVATITRRF